MSTFKIVKYTTAYKSRWDRFVASLNGTYKGSKNTSFLFQRDFMEYHNDRFEDYSLMVFEGDQVLGVLPANRDGNKVYSHQGLSYGGLVLEAEIRLQTVLEVFKQLLQFLSQSGMLTLDIKVLPQFYQELSGDELDYLLFLTEATLVKTEAASVIDLRNRIPLHSSRKDGIRKAKNNGLELVETKDFTSFWNTILIPNLQLRHDTIPVHSLTEISMLAEKFPYNIRQFNVLDAEETCVAGATIFETPTVAHVQYLSANEDRQQLGSLDLLFDYLISKYSKEKYYFDFGTSNEEAGKKLNGGLQFWKEGFGARTRVQRTYNVATANHTLLNDVIL
ncbi:GNAT family N-acetyltransferase [Leeuwenhoekiella sp. W20_SRS_FM14]|uniref:GNAT family N-acetyltransferase n=1 Tax=Leeuwenhoekiella sp. W20_SRS_FM14 TaxID=3240270 RepID=UPI003F948896